MASLSTRPIPLPQPSPLSTPFWEAVHAHRLTVQRCAQCGTWEWTPKVVCSDCLKEALVWTQVSGKATVYSFSIVRRPQSEAFEVPYVVAIVELEEGPRLMANVVGVDVKAVHIGMAVEVGFEDFEAFSIYHFTPVAPP